LFNNKIYTRKDNKWVMSPEDTEDTNKFDVIGFVSYEERVYPRS